jgi:hypothetical protein
VAQQVLIANIAKDGERLTTFEGDAILATMIIEVTSVIVAVDTLVQGRQAAFFTDLDQDITRILPENGTRTLLRQRTLDIDGFLCLVGFVDGLQVSQASFVQLGVLGKEFQFFVNSETASRRDVIVLGEIAHPFVRQTPGILKQQE